MTRVSRSYIAGDEGGIRFRFISSVPDISWNGPMSLKVLNRLTHETVYEEEEIGLSGDLYHMHLATHQDLLTRA